MIIIDKQFQKEHTFPFKKVTGEEVFTCPLCSADRKKKTDKCFSWNHDTQVGRCNHCGVAFYIKKEYIKTKEYTLPINKNNSLDEKTIKWFNDVRAISQDTLIKMYVSSGMEYMPQENKEMNCIRFKFFRNSELVNIKYRNGKKQFKLSSGAELIFYNLNSLIYNDSKEIIICEGEIDCLSFIEVGLSNCVSVPNGANKDNCNTDYLNSVIDYFDDLEKVYIATDNDAAGLNLRNELIRRIGFEKCLIVDFEDCKDFNEYLIKYGKEKSSKILQTAKEIKIEGVLKVIDFEDELDDLYFNGLSKGKIINHFNFDKLISWQTSRLLIVTGIPGMGKSEFIDELVVRLNILHNWKIGYFSPENFPIQLHASKIIEKLTGKKYHQYKLSLQEQGFAKVYLNDNFFFIKPEDENYSIDNILGKAKWLIKKFGIKVFVLDPFNRLEHQIEKGISETNYISKILDKIITFEQTYNILFILVAHPRKMAKSGNVYEVPTLYDINGSANFFNKCDYGITIYRDYLKEVIQAHIQKVKFKHLGQPGLALFRYNQENGRFMPINEEIDLSIADNTNFITNGIIENNDNFETINPF